MYTTRVSRDFIAQHYLTVPDSGPENELHSHHFELEVIVKGEDLNRHGYLVDITTVEDAIDNIVGKFEDVRLNNTPEFEGLNPSIEHFARIVHVQICDHLPTERLSDVTVRIWEDDHAWASYTN
jgi:6-pyruvoyltetrahydropterin/6-carboxytetrahydropterin synthase